MRGNHQISPSVTQDQLILTYVYLEGTKRYIVF